MLRRIILFSLSGKQCDYTRSMILGITQRSEWEIIRPSFSNSRFSTSWLISQILSLAGFANARHYAQDGAQPISGNSRDWGGVKELIEHMKQNYKNWG
jgi:hypothetical protein